MSLPARLQLIQKEITEKFGIVVNVKVADSCSMTFSDISTVYVHPSITVLENKYLKPLVLQSAALQYLYPSSWGIHQSLVEEAHAESRLSISVIENALYFAYELIADRYLGQASHWADTYRASMKDIQRWLFGAVESKLENAISANDISEAVNLKEMLPDTLRKSLVMAAIRQYNLHPFGCSRFIKMFRSDAQNWLLLLFGSAFNELGFTMISRKSVLEFAIAWSREFPALSPSNITVEIVDAMTSGDLDLYALSNIGGERIDQGSVYVANPEYATVFDITLVDAIRSSLNRGLTHPDSERTGIWQLSHPLSTLDAKRSIKSSPKLFPGLTARRKSKQSVPRSKSDRSKGLCLIVDDSASMSGKRALLARSFGEAINRYCSELSKPIGLITYGSDVDKQIEPFRDYHCITRALMALDGHLGGTRFQPVIKLISSMIEDCYADQLVWITDAGLSDWQSIGNELGEASRRFPMTILLINRNVPRPLKKLMIQSESKLKAFRLNTESTAITHCVEELIR